MGRRMVLLGETKYYQQALSYRLKGMTYQEIGNELGVSRQRAQQILRPPKTIYDFVKNRAQNKCENCQLLTQFGHVHHINNQDYNYNDTSNLDYLCISCHKTIHIMPDNRVTHCKRCEAALRKHSADFARKLCGKCIKISKCRTCSEEFKRSSRGIRYCPNCRTVSRKCRNCGKLVSRQRPEVAQFLANKFWFCNKQCQGQFLGKHYARKANRNRGADR